MNIEIVDCIPITVKNIPVINRKDIELVMQQTGVSYMRAEQSLRDNGCDLVSAIMELIPA
jgi:NACalpha-BTF3-like transcription factor